MHAAYLLENGHLFRVAVLAGGERAFGGGPGSAGRIQEFDWDGELVWDFKFHNDKQFHHHDAAKMPNGNVLMVVWDKKTADEAIAAGRKPELVSNYVLPDSIVEVKPTGKTTGEVVWEWHLWDHLVQDHDSTKAELRQRGRAPRAGRHQLRREPDGPRPARPGGPARSPIAKTGRPPAGTRRRTRSRRPRPRSSSRSATSARPAAAVAAGQPGLDPRQCGRLQPRARPDRDQRARVQRDLDHRPQHDDGRGRRPHRRPQRQGGRPALSLGQSARLPRRHQGGPDALRPAQRPLDPARPPGRGAHARLQQRRRTGRTATIRRSTSWSSRSTRRDGTRCEPGAAFGPEQAVWSYSAPKKSDFYAFFISGAHRLPNGNTLICSGPNGTLFEVTPERRWSGST